jgi:PAS domain S-box-containing protein/excisionase family DNA binding protein
MTKVLTAQEVADYLGMHVETIRRLARRREIPAFKVGNEWRFLEDVFLNWNESKVKTIIEDGKILRKKSIAKDFTERDKEQETINENEAFLRLIFDTFPNSIYIKDKDGIYILVNKRFAELHNTTPEALIGLSDLSFAKNWLTTEEKINKFRAAERQVIEKKQPLFIPEEEFIFNDGSSKWFQTTKSQITFRNNLNCLMCVAIDITERKLAEEMLRTSEAFNQAVINNSPLGVSVRSRTGKLLYFNDAWKRIWAISEAEIYEDQTRERNTLVFDSSDSYLAPHYNELQKIYQKGGHVALPNLKTEIVRPGAPEWVSQYFYALHDKSGAVDRVVILTEDITERKRSEEALRESENRFRLLFEIS